MNELFCFGAPPQLIPMPSNGPKGPGMSLTPFQPLVQRARRACALWERKELEVANDLEPVDVAV
jgi:hypothetical protein